MGNEQPINAPKPKALNPSELQTYLMVTQVKLSQSRNKKIALIKKKEEEIKKHLNENNLDIAKAKMESLMREEDFITVFDILAPLCEILKEKVTYIMISKECPSDLRASLDSLIYASTRLEIEELHMIREFIKQKFSNIYVDKAISNVDKLVNCNVVEKLMVRPAPEAEIISRLKAVCERESIEFSFPQLVNPLVVDSGVNSANNTVIPGMPIMPNFNGTGGNNFSNNPNLNGNVYPGYAIPFSNTFPQQQQQMPGNVGFPGQYNMYNYPNANMPGYPQMQINPQNLNNPNFNPYESSGLSFNNNTVPNSFSNNPGNMNQQGGNFPPQFPNNNPNFNNNMGNINQVIQPNNPSIDSNWSGYPSMPNSNNVFPQQQGKSDTMPMMGGGTAPMGNIAAGQPKNIGSFPNVNNASDLDFPSSKK